MTHTEAHPLDEPKAYQFSAAFNAIRDNIQLAIRGKQREIEHALLAMMAEGHLLLEDVPGVGKTMLAKSISNSIGAKLGRIQFTPDLLPTDVTGVSVWNRKTSGFEFRPGPIFAEIVLADEINRASPKTQSALLEAMAEAQVTIDGISRQMHKPFMVLATQNPIGQEGTYPLPESQLDRFLMKISMGYPDPVSELKILQAHRSQDPANEVDAVANMADITAMQKIVNRVHISTELREYIINLAQATRNHASISLGISPRGTLSLQRVARARAVSMGRVYVTDDDIKAMMLAVCEHRIILRPDAAMQGHTAAGVLTEVLNNVPIQAKY